MSNYNEAEKSILKQFSKTVWRRFIRGVREYKLIDEGDRIAVCISGGKDSMMLAKCMQLLQRHWKTKFELEFLVMDPGYTPEVRQQIIDNANLLEIPIKIFDSDIFDAISTFDGQFCYMCARMRRGYLYKTAQALGCNKIALGHHFDDVIETILMSVLYGGEFKTMMPKLHSENFENMELIRPLYMVKEADIIAWVKHNDLEFIQCACGVTQKNADSSDEFGSKRAEMKELIKHFRQISPSIEYNIFASCHDVNLDTIIGYHNDGRKLQYSFLDDYDKK